MSVRSRYLKSFLTLIALTALITTFLVHTVHWQNAHSVDSVFAHRVRRSTFYFEGVRIADLFASFVKYLRGFFKTEPILWPNQDDGDRILEQLAFVPPNLKEMTNGGARLKTILLLNSSRLWIIPTHPERQTFLEDNCPVNTCRITSDVSEFQNAHAVIFTETPLLRNETRPNEEQVWVLYVLESPLHTTQFASKIFNWTVSYRPDSDVPNPYGKFFPADPTITSKRQTINYAANKTKMVAWAVSNCDAANKRWEYAIELNEFIQVHIYGPCIPNNTRSCPRSKAKQCLETFNQDYKFYLSFENSNCRHYITEKFFNNALWNNVIPIVMGARREDYERVAPYHSFIHVDDFDSPKDLAQYLNKLDQNHTLYNEYFQWKGTGEFSRHLNAHFWCRFCAMLHADIPKKTYDDMDVWWRPEGTCTRETWKIKATLLKRKHRPRWRRIRRTNVLSQRHLHPGKYNSSILKKNRLR